MHEGFSANEKWPFECLRCWLVWEEEYVARRLSDGHGNDVVVWLRGGLPVQSPWAGAICPNCGCGSVTTFPAGYLAHHAEIAAASGVPAVPVTPRRPEREGRTTRPAVRGERLLRAARTRTPVPAEQAGHAGGGLRRAAWARHRPAYMLGTLLAISLLIFMTLEFYRKVRVH
ncbi:hypothetical protein [Microtetraspora fusca]|uniref:hypothetical protein n=1 Tax=Microtetraspora fusca TaxID=1997 RepID=UPI000AFBDF96|nr:hypothetical protein [Microtetraspora fusca]